VPPWDDGVPEKRGGICPRGYHDQEHVNEFGHGGAAGRFGTGRGMPGRVIHGSLRPPILDGLAAFVVIALPGHWGSPG
jgi:hypothetical protein